MFDTVYREHLPFWDRLSHEDRELLCTNSSRCIYPAGAQIHGGDSCTGVIFVKSGSLRLYMMSDDGKDITLYRLYAGDMCMLSASCVIRAITFDVFVDAEEESECFIIDGKTFSLISEKNPEVKIFALETAVSRFSDVMWIMQQILFMKTDKRLAIFLSDEMARTQDPVIRLTHEQIAKYMGSAREVVTRVLKYFSNEKIVELTRGGVKILDKRRLQSLTL